jgi:hypothetical protein
VSAAIPTALERQASLHELLASLEPRVVGEAELARFGDPERLCYNVNTPEDLAEAERWWAGGGAAVSFARRREGRR